MSTDKESGCPDYCQWRNSEGDLAVIVAPIPSPPAV